MKDSVIVITGASSGIGAALAREVAARGAHPVLVARGRPGLERTAGDCQGRALVLPADVTDRAQVQQVVAGALDHFPGVDVWVNNAGRGITRLPSELTDGDIDAMMRANVLSVLYGVQAILPHFKERGAGHLINVSSVLGRMPLAVFRAAYSGAKHFLNALTANLRTELAETQPGIHVTLVSPGVVYTDFGGNALHGGPLSRDLPGGQEPGEVARVIADVIESPRPDVYTRAGTRDRVTGYLAGLGTDP